MDKSLKITFKTPLLYDDPDNDSPSEAELDNFYPLLAPAHPLPAQAPRARQVQLLIILPKVTVTMKPFPLFTFQIHNTWLLSLWNIHQNIRYTTKPEPICPI